jgi:hypothetical protein
VLDRIADELLVREVLDADQVKALVTGQSLDEAATTPSQPTTPAPPVEDRRNLKERPSPLVPPLPKPLPQE